MEQQWDVIVIGGGQAGLASGYHLKKKGISFLILEASDQATGSWPHYYDSLKLFSPASLSSLPGMKIRGTRDHYPHRDEVIRYLQDYAKQFEFPIRTNQRVAAVEKYEDSFTIRTMTGDLFTTLLRLKLKVEKPFRGKCSTLLLTEIPISIRGKE